MQQQSLHQPQVEPVQHSQQRLLTTHEQEQSQAQVFRYRPSLKQLRLQCLLMVLMAVFGVIAVFTIGGEPIEFAWFTLLSPWTYLVWMLLSVVASWNFFNVRRQAEGLRGRWLGLAIRGGRVLQIDPEKNTSDPLLSLAPVKWFRVVEGRKGRVLEIRDDTRKWAFSSEDMASREDFDGFINLLREKLGSDKERA